MKVIVGIQRDGEKELFAKEAFEITNEHEFEETIKKLYEFVSECHEELES